ncbi:glycoside hydrolase family protein [Lonsdalea quercina]|uniref:glycoside hydrolase family protein n=1 Tax=Lonsdalea quercina TaxID=71657 RepID=UPI003975DF8A
MPRSDGYGDGTSWSSERGNLPSSGGGLRDNGGRGHDSGNNDYGYQGYNGLPVKNITLVTTASYDGYTMSLYINNLIMHEGFKNQMYADTVGNITVGIGHLISSPEMAAALPFSKTNIVRGHNSEDYNEVSLTKKQISLFFDSYKENKKYSPNIHLSNNAVIGLAINDVKSTISGLKGIYSDFDSFPNSAKVALVDMGFNLGIRKLKTNFPNFNAAVERKDWNAAADESHRTDIGEIRNQHTKVQFQQAAKSH